MKRLFIALPLDKAGRKKLDEIASSLSHFRSVLKIVPTYQYHITLKFLGDTSERQATDIITAFSSLSSNAIPYRLTGLGAFPTVSSPSVIWAGIDADLRLKDLALMVKDFTHAFGFSPEKRSFSPHLTLARVKKEKTVPPGLIEFINIHRETSLGEGTFSSLILYESVLAKTGPAHSELVTLSLNGE